MNSAEWTSMKTTSGHCLCRAIAFSYEGAPNWTLDCHCESCRRATSSPRATWTSVPRNAFRFTAGTPTYFASSPGVRRGFCARCGSPLTYEAALLVRHGGRAAPLRDDPAQRPAHPARSPEVTALDRLGLYDQRLRRAAKRLVAADARQRDGELFYDFVERGAALLQQG